MNHTTHISTRQDKLRGWMAEHGVTFTAMGKRLGISNVAARRSLFKEKQEKPRIEAFAAIGIPKSLLPKPYSSKDRRRI